MVARLLDMSHDLYYGLQHARHVGSPVLHYITGTLIAPYPAEDTGSAHGQHIQIPRHPLVATARHPLLSLNSYVSYVILPIFSRLADNAPLPFTCEFPVRIMVKHVIYLEKISLLASIIALPKK